MTSLDASTAWAVTDAGSLISTRDGGQHWVSVSSTEIHFKAVRFITANHGWATDGSAIFMTQDGGESWVDLEAPGHVTALTLVDAQHGWAAGDGRLWHTADGGETWDLQLTLPEPDRLRWEGPTWLHFSDRQDGWVLFTLGQGCASQEPYQLLHTVDGGQHWELRMMDSSACHPPFDGPRPTAPGGPGGYPVAFTVQQDMAWVLINSTAGGYVELVKVPGKGAGPISAGRLSLNAPANGAMGLEVVASGDVWLVTGDARQELGHVLHSADGGSTWQAGCNPEGTCSR